MRGVLERVSAGVAGRIINSANPKKIRTYQEAVSVAAKTREHTASVTREHKFFMETEGTCVLDENLNETVRLQFKKRQEWIQKIRGERLQGIKEGTSCAPRLTCSSAAPFLRRNECPGTHCSMIVQEEREHSFCQICQRV